MKTFSKFIFLELSNAVEDELRSWMEDGELPFSHMFKGNKYRIAYPFVTDYMRSIADRLESLGYKVNLENATATRVAKTKNNKNIKPKSPEQEAGMLRNGYTKNSDGTLSPPSDQAGNAIKLNKVILSQFGQEELDRFLADSGRYTIVISRHPIDIARMSDFDGIQSCHSPEGKDGTNYFKCAVSDAKGQGAVAYLVSNSEMRKIDDLQDDEVFADEDRNVDGATPTSRLRLRRFMNKEEDIDFAVPELRIYGSQIKEFQKNVVEFARKNVPFKDLPNFHNVSRLGGSYSDSNGGEMLNALFYDEDEPYPDQDVDYEGEDDYEGLAGQYQEELEEYTERHRAKSTNPNIHFSAEAEEIDDGYVAIYPDFSIRIPLTGLVLKKDISDIYQIKSLKEEMDHPHNISVHDRDEIWIHLEIDSIEHPDDWNSFLNHYVQEYSDKYNQILSLVYDFLYKNDYADVGHAHKAYYNSNLNFNNLEVEEYGDRIVITTPEIVIDQSNAVGGLQNIRLNVPSNDQRLNILKQEILRNINKEIANFVKFEKQQKPLPGFKFKDFINIESKVIEPKVEFHVGKISMHQYELSMYISFELYPITDHEKIKGILNYIHYFDRAIASVKQNATMLFKKLVEPSLHDQWNKVK